jgi:hypothetical protein
MARIRTIKPEFFSHEEMASVSAHARLLAIGLLCLADCKGRLRWVPMQVHSQVFPWEASVKIEVLLGELTGIGYCVHYENNGKRYVAIPKFTDHQRLSGKEANYESRLPSPPVIVEKPRENSGENGEANGKHLGASPGSNGNPLGTGEQGNIGTGEQGNSISLSSLCDAVIELWNASMTTQKIRKLTPDRKAKLTLRLKDPDWPWREAIDKLPIPNTDRFRWQPSFDWIIENAKNAYSLVEGKYDTNGKLTAGPGQVYDPNHNYEDEPF